MTALDETSHHGCVFPAEVLLASTHLSGNGRPGGSLHEPQIEESLIAPGELGERGREIAGADKSHRFRPGTGGFQPVDELEPPTDDFSEIRVCASIIFGTRQFASPPAIDDIIDDPGEGLRCR